MSNYDLKECRPPDRGAQQLVELCEVEAITCSEGDRHSQAVVTRHP